MASMNGLCAQPICRHSAEDHRGGASAGDDVRCRRCTCTAFVTRRRLLARRLYWAVIRNLPGGVNNPAGRF
jgi:hypothetical protein